MGNRLRTLRASALALLLAGCSTGGTQSAAPTPTVTVTATVAPTSREPDPWTIRPQAPAAAPAAAPVAAPSPPPVTARLAPPTAAAMPVPPSVQMPPVRAVQPPTVNVCPRGHVELSITKASFSAPLKGSDAAFQYRSVDLAVTVLNATSATISIMISDGGPEIFGEPKSVTGSQMAFFSTSVPDAAAMAELKPGRQYTYRYVEPVMVNDVSRWLGLTQLRMDDKWMADWGPGVSNSDCMTRPSVSFGVPLRVSLR